MLCMAGAGVTARARLIGMIIVSLGSAHSGLADVWIWRCRHSRTVVVILMVIFTDSLAVGVAAPHPDVAPDAHATALLREYFAQRRAFGQSRKLFGREDGEGQCLDLEAMANVRPCWLAVGLGIAVGGVFDVLV